MHIWGTRRVTFALSTPLIGALIYTGTAACSPSDGATSPVPAKGTPGAAGIGDRDFPTDGNGGYDVGHYGLKLSYDPGTHKLGGTADITAKAVQNLSQFNLDLHGLIVSKATVDGAAARVTRSGDELTLIPERTIADGSTFDVRVTYGGTPTPMRDQANLGTYGFIATKDGAFVTCEPDGAKTWFPSNDHPADKATYDFEITVPRGLTAIANGELTAPPRTIGADTTYSWRERHPMASYLATMTLGEFKVKTGETAKGIPNYTAVDPRFSGSLDSVYQQTGKVTDYWATVFGPYPFSSTGAIVDDYNAGYALENQTKPIYGGFAPDTATLVHELAHQWFGDSVSIERWHDLWLNEGFATYAEWLWSEHTGNGTAETIFQGYYKAKDDAMWSYPPGRARKDDLFDQSVYTRGAMTLQALRRTIGDDDFFALLKDWTTTHKYGNATTDEFIAAAERISSRQLDSLFDAWLFKPGRPALS
ncbi:MAG TPA: M1 family metallopeptidase [Thermopolyspora sp.]|jgi:Aminopeptidase N